MQNIVLGAGLAPQTCEVLRFMPHREHMEYWIREYFAPDLKCHFSEKNASFSPMKCLHLQNVLNIVRSAQESLAPPPFFKVLKHN